MSVINNGGPAFARSAAWQNGTNVSYSQEGMSLRDYFAAHAAAALFPSDRRVKLVAEASYRLADAMLLAREVSVDRADE